MFASSSVPTIIIDHVAVSSARAMHVDHRTDVQSCTESYDSSNERVICYGMILDRGVYTCPGAALAYTHNSDKVVHFYPPRNIRCYMTGHILGQLSQFDGDVLSRLAVDREFRLQLTYHALPAVHKPSRRTGMGLIGHMETIIYGPRYRFSDIGDYITQCGWFLEDPVGCDENVPYLNPQCLFSLHEQPPMTFGLCGAYGTKNDAFERTSSDVLAGFETTDHLEETMKPTAISTDLKSHQCQALTFFQRRERGLHPSKNEIGIWSGEITHGSKLFVNILTGQTQRDPNPVWRGGILADEMGLGKTLSVIALVAADRDTQLTVSNQKVSLGTLVELDSTLIVVPLNVLAVWESQLKRHTIEGKLTWINYHGKSRLRNIDTLSSYDIVFTTYQTIEREKRSSKSKTDSLFSYHWKRIVLDEAHIIRNHATATARAVAALQATSRWAITGTPMQNNLTDFLGLFVFLHFTPYEDPRAFDKDISDLWRSKPHMEAVETFKKLLSCILIRRTTSILGLPVRKDKIVLLPFDSEEEQCYRQIEKPLIDILDDPAVQDSASPHTWNTTIQQINKLRLFCNLGITTPSHPSDLAQPAGIDARQAALVVRLAIGGDVCGQCLQPFETSLNGDELKGSPTCSVYYSTCDLLFCVTCSMSFRYQAPAPCACIDNRQICPLLPLLPGRLTPTMTPTGSVSPSPSPMDVNTNERISSKVRALLGEIESQANQKHVVFSAWTSSLDMVERGLDSIGLSFVRIDGKVATKKRGPIIEQFRNKASVRVILMTVSCGAFGLDLTAASQVHLLEPQWNPSVEDQALARAHRLGQTRPVTTYRYIMKDSFEEHILKVQDRKKLLATTLLSNESSMKILRDLIHEGKQQGTAQSLEIIEVRDTVSSNHG